MLQFLAGLAGTALFISIAWPFIKRKKASRFSAALMFIAGACLMAGVFGTWLDTLTGWIPQAMLGVGALCALAVLGIGLFLDAKDGRVDRPGQWIAFTLPVILCLLPGALGTQTQDLVNNVGHAGNGTISQMGAQIGSSR